MPWNPEHYDMKKENPIAKEVRTPKYRQRIVKDKTVYDRKKSHSEEMQDQLEPIPCPMHEDYDDDMDYRQADYLDEIKDVERVNKNT